MAHNIFQKWVALMINKAYKLSFVIPVYNRQTILARCIESVLNANRDDLQIIIVDDASTDNSKSTIESYANIYNNIKPIFCRTNGGPGIARNIGLENADGMFVLFLDSDDTIESFNIDSLVDSLENDIDVVKFNTRAYSHDNLINSYTTVVEVNEKIDNECFFSKYEDGSNCVLWQYCFNRQFLIKAEVKFPAIRAGEDATFSISALSHAKSFKTITCIIYNYVIGEINQITSNQSMLFSHNDANQLRKLVKAKLETSKGSLLRWLLKIDNMMLWRTIKEDFETLPVEMEDELKLLADKLKDIGHPVWFMPATNSGLYECFKHYAEFIMGGFVDNRRKEKVVIHGNEYVVCTPSMIVDKPNAIVVFSITDSFLVNMLKQLNDLGYNMEYESYGYAPKLLILR